MRILILIICFLSVSAYSFTLQEFNDWKTKAEQGDLRAQVRLGFCYKNGNYGQGVTKNPVEAVKWFRKAAEQGEPEGQSALAYCYYEGSGVIKDQAEAVKWYLKSAEQGSSHAQIKLGYCYYKGEGVTKDPVEAYAYFNVAGVTNAFAEQNRKELEGVLSSSQIEAGQKRSKELLALIEDRKKANSK